MRGVVVFVGVGDRETMDGAGVRDEFILDASLAKGGAEGLDGVGLNERIGLAVAN